MSRKFEEVQVEVIELDSKDIIITSGCHCEGCEYDSGQAEED